MFVLFHLYVRYCLGHWDSNKKLHELRTDFKCLQRASGMAVVLAGRHLRGRLVLVIELRKLEFIWVGMVSCRRAEHAARYRAGSIDGNGGQADHGLYGGHVLELHIY